MRVGLGGSGIAFAAQVVLHFAEQGLELAAAYAQGHAGGEYVDDHQVQQARDHGAELVKAFGVIGAEVDATGAGQG